MSEEPLTVVQSATLEHGVVSIVHFVQRVFKSFQKIIVPRLQRKDATSSCWVSLTAGWKLERRTK